MPQSQHLKSTLNVGCNIVFKVKCLFVDKFRRLSMRTQKVSPSEKSFADFSYLVRLIAFFSDNILLS